MSPPTRLNRFAPIFPVADLRRALAHYGSLGFETLAYEGGDDYGFAERDGVGLHLAASADRDPQADERRGLSLRRGRGRPLRGMGSPRNRRHHPAAGGYAVPTPGRLPRRP